MRSNHKIDFSIGNPLPNGFGLTGGELSTHLRENGIECEYSDPYSLVLMFSPYTQGKDYERLLKALSLLPQRPPIEQLPLLLPQPLQRMSIRQAMLSRAQEIPVSEAAGRICARTAVSCQPSIPIAVPGEEMTDETVSVLKTYGAKSVKVIC